MILQDENGKFINPEDFKRELFSETLNDEIDESVLESDLVELYMNALTADLQSYDLPQFTMEEGLFSGFGKKILEKIRSFICPELNSDSTQDTIVDTILDAIASIVPGGKIITWIVKKLIKFILGKGIASFCPAQ